jgi:hypothetical protein
MIENLFQNETEAFTIDQLDIENRVDRIQFGGSLEITRDKVGLERARLLKELVDRVVDALEAEDLPDAVTVEESGTVSNPFA